MFGPPGAGKGTQSENLVKKFNLYKISTGDLLREEIKKKSSLGNKIKIIMDQGQLVSDDIINNLIEGLISNKEYHNRCIFDGYPRTLNQAKNLDNLIHKHNQKISLVLSLDVDEETIIKRILGRQTCSKCGLIFNQFFLTKRKISLLIQHSISKGLLPENYKSDPSHDLKIARMILHDRKIGLREKDIKHDLMQNEKINFL